MSTTHAPQQGDMIRVQGNREYLPVASRVQWFRGDHPDWTIDTAVVQLDYAAGWAVMRAEVRDDTGRIIAAGTKTETRKGFGDFVEKAETGAVGRALARAGYGTEDALDLEGDRYADAPIEQSQGGERSSAPGKRAGSTTATTRPATDLRERLALVAAEHNIGLDTISALADEVGVPKGQRATDEQMLAIIARIEQPVELAGAHALPADGAADRSGSAAPTETPQSEGMPSRHAGGSEAATSAAVEPPPSTAAAAPTDDEILAAAGEGAEMVPPKPGTPEYKALPNGTERAKAKAWWDAHKEEEPTLAEALGAPSSD